MTDYRYHRTRWLWWTTLWILLAGAGVFWILQSKGDTDEQTMIFVGAGFLLLVGVCIIGATSDWWFKR